MAGQQAYIKKTNNKRKKEAHKKMEQPKTYKSHKHIPKII